MATKKTRSRTRKPAKKIARAKAAPFSAQEKRIVRTMTAKGATMREIAAKLGRAPSSIWRHQQTAD